MAAGSIESVRYWLWRKAESRRISRYSNDATKYRNACAPQLNWGAQDLNSVRRCPTFPPGLGSIIGAGWLSFRVRDGSGRFPAAMAAVTLFNCVVELFWWWGVVGLCVVDGWLRVCVVSFRPVSASSLRPLRGV